MTFDLNQIWYDERYVQDTLPKIDDNTIKDNVSVTSSNFSRNDGTITILNHLLAKIHSKSPLTNKILIQ